MTTTREGRCLCGDVRFVATEVPDTIGICHCRMCRRWTGSALIGVTVKAANIEWQGEEKIRSLQTSGWARRAWCGSCGSNLFFQITTEGPYAGELEIPVGLFDDADGFTVTNEIYIDHKPDSYAFEGSDRQVLTRRECIDRFPMLDSD